MASTGAVTQFAERIIGAILDLFMFLAFEVVCVAASTIWLVGSIRPVEGLIVVGMTVQASNTGVVVTGVVAG